MTVPRHAEPIEIVSPTQLEHGPVLIDGWGRPHPVTGRTVVGRILAQTDMMVSDPSISRVHAVIERAPGSDRWMISDLDSTNGTFMNGQRIGTNARLRARSRVVLGSVGFVWLGNATDQVGAPLILNAVGEECMPLSIFSFTDGTGLACYGPHVAQLNLLEYGFVRCLIERALSDAELDADSRGYVRHMELAYTLPWEGLARDSRPVQPVATSVQRVFDACGICCRVQFQARRGYRLH